MENVKKSGKVGQRKGKRWKKTEGGGGKCVASDNNKRRKKKQITMNKGSEECS